MKLIFKDEALKQLKKIGGSDRQKAWRKLEIIKSHPLAGKKLQGEYLSLRSLTAWPLRIFYTFDPKSQVIEIIAIKYRGGAYK